MESALHTIDVSVDVKLCPLVCVKVEITVKDVETLLEWIVRDEHRLFYSVNELRRQPLFSLSLESISSKALCQLSDELIILSKMGQHLFINHRLSAS